jgi:hypothetical protein
VKPFQSSEVTPRVRSLTQNLLVGPIGLLEEPPHLFLQFRRGGWRLGNVLDQIACILQERLDPGDVRKVVSPALPGRRQGQAARLLDQGVRFLDPFSRGNQAGYTASLGKVYQ